MWTCALSLFNFALFAFVVVGPLVSPLGSEVALDIWSWVQPPVALACGFGIFLALAALPLRNALVVARRALRLRPAQPQTRDDVILELSKQKVEKKAVVPRLDLSG